MDDRGRVLLVWLVGFLLTMIVVVMVAEAMLR